MRHRIGPSKGCPACRVATVATWLFLIAVFLFVLWKATG